MGAFSSSYCMDQFEAARLKHQKSLERKQRIQPVAQEVKAAILSLPEQPKEEKVSLDAVIEVVVKLPDRVLSFSLKRRNIYANVHPSRMNKQEIANHVARGLEPLMGRVD